MNRIGLIVFDMAGTTVSDAGDVASGFRTAFDKAGIGDITTKEIRQVMGYHKLDAIRSLLDRHRQLADKEKEQKAHEILAYFETAMVDFYLSSPELQPISGAEQAFAYFHQRGVKIALNTGFTRVILEAILSRLNWRQGANIDAVVASDDVKQGRPAPDMIRLLMSRTGITDPQQVAKVGDTEVDIHEGRNAGCGLVISVTTGTWTAAELMEHRPDYIIDHLVQLQHIIKFH